MPAHGATQRPKGRFARAGSHRSVLCAPTATAPPPRESPSDLFEQVRPPGPNSENEAAYYFDFLLARELGRAPEHVLVYLRDRPDIPIGDVCGHSGRDWSGPDETLLPYGLLGIVRRRRSVSAVSRSDLQKERLACLAAITQRLNRQLRIYLNSFGAEDTKSDEAKKLCSEDRMELERVVEKVRGDPMLQARRDGKFPDGPFRLDGIPPGVVELCAGRQPVANPEGPWHPTDEVNDLGLPKARLLNACEVAPDEWDISCEDGGFTIRTRRLRVQRRDDRWLIVQGGDTRGRPAVDLSARCAEPCPNT